MYIDHNKGFLTARCSQNLSLYHECCDRYSSTDALLSLFNTLLSGRSVLIRPVCTDHACLYWSGLSILIRPVYTDPASLYWSGLSVLIRPVCTDQACMYWSGMSVRIRPVCTSTSTSLLQIFWVLRGAFGIKNWNWNLQWSTISLRRVTMSSLHWSYLAEAAEDLTGT